MAVPTDLLTGQAPVLDDVAPAPVSDAFEAGEEADVPYLAGTTDLEIPTRTSSSSDATPGRAPAALLDRLAAEAVAAYGSEAELDLHLLSDVLFTEPARHLTQEHADDAPRPLPLRDRAGHRARRRRRRAAHRGARVRLR